MPPRCIAYWLSKRAITIFVDTMACPEEPKVTSPPRSQVRPQTVLAIVTVLCLFGGVIYVLFRARFAFTLIALSAIISVALNHAVDGLVRIHLRRSLAIAVVFLLLLGAFTGIGFLFAPMATEQGEALVKAIPKAIESIRKSPYWLQLDELFRFESRLSDFLSELPHWIDQAVPSALKAASQVVTGVTSIITVLVLSLFMLVFAPALIRRLLAEALPYRQGRYKRVVENLYKSIGGFASGLAIVVSANAVCTSIFLAIIHVPYFLPLGMINGLSSLIPFIGNMLAGILLSLVALATGGVWKGIGMAIYCVLYQQVENHLLGPLVYRQTVNINPLVSMLALLVMTDLFGLLGALAAVPLVAVVQVVLGEVMALRRERWGLTTLEDGHVPAAASSSAKSVKVSGAQSRKKKGGKPVSHGKRRR